MSTHSRRSKQGSTSLQTFSEAQNVVLSYNEDGQLLDRGTTEGAEAIMDLLENEWGYPVNQGELDPNDPLVNTATEYMYPDGDDRLSHPARHADGGADRGHPSSTTARQFPAGEYELFVRTVGDRGELGGYWTDFDRMHPIEGPARSQAWSGTAHALYGELGVGAVTASTLQLSTGISAMIFGLGMVLIVLGAGLIWIAMGKDDTLYFASESEDEPRSPPPPRPHTKQPASRGPSRGPSIRLCVGE